MRLAPVAIPDWRNASAYEALLHADRACFAWEWLRRDPRYRAAALGDRATGQPPTWHDNPGSWGLHAFEPPDLDFRNARPVWTASSYDKVVVADALETADPDGAFDLGKLAHMATLVGDPQGRERLLLSDGLHVVRLDLRTGSVAKGPVLLGFYMIGPRDIAGPHLCMRQLLALVEKGRFAPYLHRPDTGAWRWVLQLRAADALAAGASQRDIAEVLLGLEPGRPRWRAESPTVRTQAQRLVQAARRLAQGGYRALLR